MLDYQLEERGRWSEAIRAQVDVEFLEDQDAQPELLEPDDRMDGRRWRTRAAMIGLAAMVLIAGAAIHGGAGPRAKKASPNVTHSAPASQLLITVEISSGNPSSRTTTQTVANQPNKVDIIHNQSARRSVTVTAPQGAAIPMRRLHRTADQLARLSGSEQMESTALLRCAADLHTAANLFICK